MSPLDRTRHSKTTAAVAGDGQAAAQSGVTGRLPYREVLREFALMLGAELAREHMAEARDAEIRSEDDDG